MHWRPRGVGGELGDTCKNGGGTNISAISLSLLEVPAQGRSHYRGTDMLAIWQACEQMSYAIQSVGQ